MGVDVLADPTVLEDLARRIFGEGDRPAGWFPRKLRRERVDPTLSVLALRPGAEVSDRDAWLGYVLVGNPESLEDAARTSGTGVVPAARGRGLASALLDDAARRCRNAGLRRLELLARAELVPFYLERGFSRRRSTVTVVGFGDADEAEPLAPPRSWRPLRPDELEPIAWLPEAWEGTEATARGMCELDSATAWLSREGTAWLVQRLVLREQWSPVDAIEALRRRMPRGAPLLLPMLPPDAAWTQALLDRGFAVAQRAALLERSLGPGAPGPRFTGVPSGSHDDRKPRTDT